MNTNYVDPNYMMMPVDPSDDRLIGGGFLGPFILGGITGGLLAPSFNGGYGRPGYYNNYNAYQFYFNIQNYLYLFSNFFLFFILKFQSLALF